MINRILEMFSAAKKKVGPSPKPVQSDNKECHATVTVDPSGRFADVVNQEPGRGTFRTRVYLLANN